MSKSLHTRIERVKRKIPRVEYAEHVEVEVQVMKKHIANSKVVKELDALGNVFTPREKGSGVITGRYLVGASIVSKNAGNGVFLDLRGRRSVSIGTRLMRYSGTCLTKEEVALSDSMYLVGLSNGGAIDAGGSKNVAGMINDDLELEEGRHNCILSEKLEVVTAAAFPAGEVVELVWSYKPRYWVPEMIQKIDVAIGRQYILRYKSQINKYEEEDRKQGLSVDAWNQMHQRFAVLVNPLSTVDSANPTRKRQVQHRGLRKKLLSLENSARKSTSEVYPFYHVYHKKRSRARAGRRGDKKGCQWG
jgi:hypothetical protein